MIYGFKLVTAILFSGAMAVCSLGQSVYVCGANSVGVIGNNLEVKEICNIERLSPDHWIIGLVDVANRICFVTRNSQGVSYYDVFTMEQMTVREVMSAAPTEWFLVSENKKTLIKSNVSRYAPIEVEPDACFSTEEVTVVIDNSNEATYLCGQDGTVRQVKLPTKVFATACYNGKLLCTRTSGGVWLYDIGTQKIEKWKFSQRGDIPLLVTSENKLIVSRCHGWFREIYETLMVDMQTGVASKICDGRVRFACEGQPPTKKQ